MWVKCSDQMPPDKTLCLVYGKGRNWVEPCVIVAEWWHGHDGARAEGEWCNVGYDQNDWLMAEEVTHWMPMPVAPSEEPMTSLAGTNEAEIQRLKKLIDLLRSGLEDVVNPLRKIKREMPEGNRLDGGLVIHLLNNHSTYISIAKKTLLEYEKENVDELR